MNLVVLMGRLTRDPEIKYAKDNMCVAKFTLAVDRREKNKTDFITCTAFGKTAEFIEKYIKKGTKIVLEGRWQTSSYTNNEGTTVYTNDCIVDHVEFAESKKAEETAPKASDDSFMNVPENIDDEVPFLMG